MRITELLESKDFKDIDDMLNPKKDDNEDGIGFDLAEDLSFFMNHDDDAYRRHFYPAIIKCVESIKRKKPTSPKMFKEAVVASYKDYIKKFPSKDLPDALEGQLFKETCEKIHEEVCQQISDGKYKD